MADSGSYVYIHKRTTDGRVFYVGQGRGGRAWSNKSRNRHWHFVVEKHGYEVEIVEDRLQQWFACEREIELILFYKEHGMSLVNITDGGEGSLGFSPSRQHRDSVSAALKVRWSDEGFAARMKANAAEMWANPEIKAMLSAKISASKMGEAARKRASETLIGITRSDATRQKMRDARRSSMRQVKCVTTGETFESLSAATRWLKTLGFSKARNLGVRVACEGKVKHAYSHKWEFAGMEV